MVGLLIELVPRLAGWALLCCSADSSFFGFEGLPFRGFWLLPLWFKSEPRLILPRISMNCSGPWAGRPLVVVRPGYTGTTYSPSLMSLPLEMDCSPYTVSLTDGVLSEPDGSYESLLVTVVGVPEQIMALGDADSLFDFLCCCGTCRESVGAAVTPFNFFCVVSTFLLFYLFRGILRFN